MSRVVVIGGTGHVGTYLIPRLVNAGHHVTVVSRSQRQPYRLHGAWGEINRVTIDRTASEADGTFGQRILDLEPEVVIDMICFTQASAQHLVESLRDRVQHFLHCGSIWVHGPSVEVPTTEMQPRMPFGEYGAQKAAIESYLLDEARRNGFPATVLHPGHIVGPGWTPLNPAANFDADVYRRLATGDVVLLPNLGMETVHHVHADDVAQAFMQAVLHWAAAVGESFHVVSPAAVSLRGYAQTVASWFGREPNLNFLAWEEWRSLQSEQNAQATYDHIQHSPNCSIGKALRLINFRPRYSSFEAVYESVMYMIESGEMIL